MQLKSPITRFLYFRKNMTLIEYAEKNNLSYASLAAVVNGHGTSQKVIDQLKEDNLYYLLEDLEDGKGDSNG